MMGLELPKGMTAPKHFKVWAENWNAVLMFCRLQTQWRQGPRGPVGLDLNVAQWFFSLYEVADPAAMLEDLQIMETTYLLELYS